MMTTSERWAGEIEAACTEPDWALSNRLITNVHHRLSETLLHALGKDAGPNFHSWAVWGSRKAGETIRQEDLDSAIYNATVTAGLVGAAVGAGVGVAAARRIGWRNDGGGALVGAGVGMLVGAWTGKQLAGRSRRKAAETILAGNRLVLRDIGMQTACFLELLESGATMADRQAFFAGIRTSHVHDARQNRLAEAFRFYLVALDSRDPAVQREAMIAGNCEAVYHEHIRLEPYIRRAMPWIVRRCATQRMMTYEVGTKVLTVGEDIPGCDGLTAARDWTRIEERMRYVFALFRKFHGDPMVTSSP